jgi:hypothetical protein
MMGLLEPKEVTIDGRNFVLSKFPAVAGREIISKYPISAMPKLGDYKVNEETMFKLMKFVGVKQGDTILCLTTPALIDNHTRSWETLMKVEWAMIEYNCTFFQNGALSTSLEDTAPKVLAWISKISTALSARSLRTEKQPSTS